MSYTPWHTDKWYTSPWNFAPEATKEFNFAKKIKFHDVTLRDGEQQAGLVFNRDQKIALAEKMAEVGMHRIEAGMPAVSAQDREAIVEIAKRFDKPGDPFAPSSALLRKAFVKLKSLGIEAQVMPWTGGDKVETYERLWDLGPDSFGTDYPEVLGEFLKRRGITTRDISAKAKEN